MSRQFAADLRRCSLIEQEKREFRHKDARSRRQTLGRQYLKLELKTLECLISAHLRKSATISFDLPLSQTHTDNVCNQNDSNIRD
jgi:hypothetical protein